MLKLLTGVIADQIYANSDQKKLLPEGQKGCRKGSRGTNDLLYIDIAVIKVKSRNKNLVMAWIDYKKAWYGSTFADYRMFRFLQSSKKYYKFLSE